MKQNPFTLLLAILLGMVGIQASAYDIEVAYDDDLTIYYDYNSDKTELTVSNTAFPLKFSGNVVIPSYVTYNGKTYSVTSIGTYAFYSCNGLTSVTIPESITGIGASAFSGCSNLTSVTINSNAIASATYNSSSTLVDIFGTQVQNYVFGDDVQSIGAYACYGWTNLTSVTIGNNVTSVGRYAFESRKNKSLPSITINSNAIASATYSSSSSLADIFGTRVKNYVFGDGVQSIGAYACYGCSDLTSVTIPCSVTSIGECAFASTGIKSITIPESVTSIGNSAFSDCSGLTSITINSNTITSATYSSSSTLAKIFGTQVKNYVFGDEVQSIGAYACYGCLGLTSVTIGNNVNSIGDYSFYNCSGLTSIVVESGNTKYDSRNECNAIIETESNTLILGCENTIIPNSVISIGNEAFYGCTGLQSITIPESVTSIGTYAFASTGIKSITIPDNVTSIGADAFYSRSLETLLIGRGVELINNVVGNLNKKNPNLKNITIIGNGSTVLCKGTFQGLDKLTSVTLGDGVKTIEEGVFQNCKALIDLDLGGINDIGNKAFYGCTGLTFIDLSRVKNIGNSAFYGCTGLEQVDLSNVETIAKAFGGCDGLHSMKFSKKLQSMELATFNSLTEIYADELETLFRVKVAPKLDVDYYLGEEKLNTLTIPEGVTTIPADCFSCITATTIILPSTLTTIEEDALCGTHPEVLYSYAMIPPQITSDNTLWMMDNTTLYVPYGSNRAYKEDKQWKYITHIVEMSREGEMQAETVTVAEAGGLRDALFGLEATKIYHLVIKGYMNAADIKLIRAREGRLSTLETLDLSDVTFVPSNEPYMSYSRVYDGSFMQHQYRYIIGTERRDETWMDGLSQAGPVVHDHYDYCLPMAFSNMPLLRVVLPASFNEIGDGMFSDCKNLEEVVAPSPITVIGASAFSGCSSLTTSTELRNVTKLGDAAFSGCTLLQVLDDERMVTLTSLDSIPNEAFKGCTSIKSAAFSNQLKSIGNDAFANSGIQEVSLTKTVTEIGERAFSSTPIKKFVWPSGVIEIAAGTFKGCDVLSDVQLPDNLYRIGESAFAECSLLNELEIPQQLARISYYAFNKTPWYENLPLVNGVKYAGNVAMECNETNMIFREGATGIADNFNGEYSRTKSANVQLPSSLRYIGSSAFTSATINNVILPESLEEIADYAFQKCTNLSSINLPESLRSVGDRSFSGTPLETITIPENVETIGYEAFGSNSSLIRASYLARKAEYTGPDYSSPFAGCSSLESVTIGDAVETIPDNMFRESRSLIKVNMGKNVKHIGKKAFYYCPSLGAIELPEGLLTIGDEAFSSCSSISELKLPESIQTIGDGAFSGLPITKINLPAGLKDFGRAFSGCSQLMKVVSNITHPYEISEDAFRSETKHNGTLYVPANSIELYKSTPAWKYFANIVGIGDENAIKGITPETSKPSAYYHLNGVKSNGQRGLNIIRMNDGTTRKVIVK